MTETQAISDHRRRAIGPGRLVLVTGPSGAGKDTLLRLAKAACTDDRNIVFSRRVITREASVFEQNEEVGLDAFRQALSRGEYAVHWEAHGHCYALRREIDHELCAGRTVVANVSRTVIGVLRHSYANVLVVSITAPPQVLFERLAMRRRSSDGKIESRCGRTIDETLAAPDVTLINTSSAEYHGRQLVRIIKGDASDFNDVWRGRVSRNQSC